jgi:hypothetical protein
MIIPCYGRDTQPVTIYERLSRAQVSGADLIVMREYQSANVRFDRQINKPPRDQVDGVVTHWGMTRPRGGTWVNVSVTALFQKEPRLVTVQEFLGKVGAAGIPDPCRNSLFSLQKFPVPLHREFGRKALKLLGSRVTWCAKRPRNCRIPCSFPC